MAVETETRKSKLAEQRKGLPDQPGVYLFRDARGRVIYVGKAKSVRKRVASHFSARGPVREMIDNIEYLVVQTEAEALLAEQNFIKQYKPRFNIRLRDDKSYPYIAISLDEDFPRVYFTRERHRRDRAYFGPYSSAKRVRGTLDLLGKIFLFRSCEGPEPGRRSGSPCLDYYIKRCGAPCVGYVSQEEYREGIDGVVAFLSGALQGHRARPRAAHALRRRRARLRAGGDRAQPPAGGARAARAPARLRRPRGDLRRGRGRRRRDRGQRPGLPGARRRPVRPPVLLPRQPGGVRRRARGRGVPPAVLRERAVDPGADRGRAELEGDSELDVLAEMLSERRGGPVEVRAAERGDKRRILELAERNARLALDQEKLRSERRRQQRVEALDGLQRALGLDALPVRIECFDISNIGGTHTVASMVVFEGGAPKKSDYRRFTIRTVEGATITPR